MKLQHRYLLLAVLAVTGVVGMAVGYRLWRDRVARSTAILRDEARRHGDHGDHGDIDKAIQAYAHYMEYAGTRADDRVALAEYAGHCGDMKQRDFDALRRSQRRTLFWRSVSPCR